MSHYIFMDYYMYIILITKNIKFRSPNVIEARGTKKKIETNKLLWNGQHLDQAQNILIIFG